MKKLFTTRYGSMLYGTGTPTSDVDLKHIVLPDLDTLLVGKTISIISEKTNIEKNVRNSVEDVDKDFIPVQIFAKHFLDGQTYALEIAFAVEYNAAHQELHDPRFLGFCRELRNQFLTSNMSALIGYSVNQASLYSFKGERLNAVREAKKLIEIFNGSNAERPLDNLDAFNSTAEAVALAFPKYFEVTTYAIDVAGTQRPCVRLLEKVLPYTNTFATMLKTVDALLNKYGSRAEAAAIDNTDWKATMHALRVVNEGISLLKDRHLTFPFDAQYVDLLLSIKRGELPYPHVIGLINEKLDELKTLEGNSSLPKKSPELVNHLNVWLSEWMRLWYGIK